MSNLAKGLVDESTREVISIISARERPPLSSATTLCGTNAECDCINFECLTHLPGSIHVYVAKDRGDQRCLERCAPKQLTLKNNAKVILTTNIDIKKKLVNGRTGIIQNCFDEIVTVLFEGDQVATQVARFTFSSPLGCRVQLPLRLAWARTVHRTQSLTLQGNVHLELSKLTQPGQLAVALSRATSLELLSASGKFTAPPQRGEITAFYFTLEGREVC